MISNTPLLCRPQILPIRTVAPTSSPLSTSGVSGHCRLTHHHLNSRWRQKELSFPGSSVLIPRLSAISCKVGIAEINETQFTDSVLKSDLPVLVEFVANWCGPCRLIAPAIQWVAQEYEGRLTVVKIDHDANPKLIEEFKVYGLPALILFKNGEEVPNSRREGAITRDKLKEYVDTLLQTNSVA